jgi:hypothetical protein
MGFKALLSQGRPFRSNLVPDNHAGGTRKFTFHSPVVLSLRIAILAAINDVRCKKLLIKPLQTTILLRIMKYKKCQDKKDNIE